MKSPYEKPVADEFVARIHRLTEKTQARWGKMDVAQMLTHCQKPLEIASGSLVFKPNFLIKFLFGKSARKQLLNAPEFKKNLPTFSEARIVDKRVFENEKQKLIALIHNFQAKGHEGLTNEEHPFFGRLNAEEWNILQVKHLDHHLRQFGV